MQAHLWLAETAGPGEVLTITPGDVAQGVALDRDGSVLAVLARTGVVGHPGSVEIWSWAERELRCVIPGRHGYGLAVSPDGQTLAAFDTGLLTLWRTATCDGEVALDGSAALIGTEGGAHVAFSPDGRLVAATGTTGMAGIWEVAAGQPLRDVWRAAPPYAQANGVAFAPDGSWLVIGDNECCASIWAIQGGEPTAVLQHGSLVNQVVAGRDGDWVIAIGVDESSMWHVASGELIRRFAGMSAAGALSPDGELLAGAIDGGVSIRQVATGTEVHRLRGHEAGVTSISFHPNGRYLITASADGSVRAWALEIDELLEIADMRATRSLTEDECRQYHLDPCPPR